MARQVRALGIAIYGTTTATAGPIQLAGGLTIDSQTRAHDECATTKRARDGTTRILAARIRSRTMRAQTGPLYSKSPGVKGAPNARPERGKP